MSYPRQVLPGSVYLVTRRCTQRQFLLRPDDETNNAFVYCFAYAAKRAGIGVVAFIANSNHYHAVVVDTEGQIPKFLEVFHRLLAKHQNVLRGGRRENFWSAQQTSLVELIGADDIIAKTLYTLTNPVKDILVERANEWPGATSLQGTLDGTSLTAQRPRRFFRATGKMPASVELAFVQPPALMHLSRHDYRQTFVEGIQAIETEAYRERVRTGRRVLGRRAILAQSPFARPSSHARRCEINPRVAARDKGARIEALLRIKAFRAAHAAARQAWLAGLAAIFPPGTWSLRALCAVVAGPTLSPMSSPVIEIGLAQAT